MVRYMKCPRCELNYINADERQYCEVCEKEMKGIPTGLEDFEEEEEDLPTEICPICGENMMRPGEKMCDECKKKSEYEEEEPDPDEDDEWREYLDDADDDLSGEMDELGEKFGEEFEDEEEEEEPEEEFEDTEEEDLEYVTGDEIYTLSGDDDDEDDEKSDDDDF